MPKISLGVPRLPWPKKGDEPFRSSADAKSEARLDMVHRSLYSYALAYKEAADRLVNCALGRRAVHLDLAVLPVMFLYRHYLELALKNIICRGRRCGLEEAGISHTHDLSRLWRGARSVLEELWPGQSRIELAAVENCVFEFHQHDESSEESRYPVSREKGEKRETLRSLTRVDIRNLKRVMAGVAVFLDGCADAIDDMNSDSQ